MNILNLIFVEERVMLGVCFKLIRLVVSYKLIVILKFFCFCFLLILVEI